MLFEPRCVRHVSLDRVCRSTLRFPPLGPPRRVPQLRRYYQNATTSCHLCHRTSFPSFGSTSVSLIVSLPSGRVGRSGLELVTRFSCRGITEERTGPPKFLGNQLSVCTCSNPTPAGLLAPDHYGAAAWPLVIERQRLPRKVFRRSIAWLSNSLSTLRSEGYPAPRKTRFQLLVRLYWTGFSPARFR